MKAKEYLTQLKNLNDLLSALSEELNSAEMLAASISTTMSDVPSFSTGHKSDRTATAAIKLAELRREIKETLDKYIGIKLTATRLINDMKDLQGATVLYHYYLHNRTLEGTAGEMNRTYQNVCRIRDRAIIEFQELMDKEGIE